MRTIAEDLYLDSIYYETIAAKQTTNYAIRARYILIHPNVFKELKKESNHLMTMDLKTDHIKFGEPIEPEAPIRVILKFRGVPLVETYAVDEDKRWEIIV